ncbi:hypothetical protein Y1Q_0021723 [Alligator mississippiensis]|uniref:Uncharacterized protein n=1 Tax=Alligator mississippiensis TaxID=8496 RepID=A0A151PAW2_ALLMI|nr:hypothetical protein Y1Q_0021723 [Alligator mississippiensis]
MQQEQKEKPTWLVSHVFIQLQLANDVTGNHQPAMIKMASGGGKGKCRADPGSVGMSDPHRDSPKEEEAAEEKLEEASDARGGNSSREQTANSRGESGEAPVTGKDSSIRGGSEGHVETLTTTGGSVGSSGEEEEFSPPGDSWQEQQKGPWRDGA